MKVALDLGEWGAFFDEDKPFCNVVIRQPYDFDHQGKSFCVPYSVLKKLVDEIERRLKESREG